MRSGHMGTEALPAYYFLHLDLWSSSLFMFFFYTPGYTRTQTLGCPFQPKKVELYSMSTHICITGSSCRVYSFFIVDKWLGVTIYSDWSMCQNLNCTLYRTGFLAELQNFTAQAICLMFSLQFQVVQAKSVARTQPACMQISHTHVIS